MLLSIDAYVHAPLASVEAKLDDFRLHLEDWAGVAFREGDELHAQIGLRFGNYSKAVKLELGMPEIRRSGVVYPISWTAVGAKGLFPTLTAELGLHPEGRDLTRLSINGTYVAPLGPVGRVIDRTLLRNVAVGTVTRWLDRLAEALDGTAD